jgi:hypothetical protein
MFWLMVVISMFIYDLHLISDVGLSQNLIQSKLDNDFAFVKTVWSTQILRGILMALWALCLAVDVYLLGQAFCSQIAGVLAMVGFAWARVPPNEAMSASATHCKWARWALVGGNKATARRHAWKAFTHAPFSLASIRVLVCAIRGY